MYVFGVRPAPFAVTCTASGPFPLEGETESQLPVEVAVMFIGTPEGELVKVTVCDGAAAPPWTCEKSRVAEEAEMLPAATVRVTFTVTWLLAVLGVVELTVTLPE
jgi:hypothetical protein